MTGQHISVLDHHVEIEPPAGFPGRELVLKLPGLSAGLGVAVRLQVDREALDKGSLDHSERVMSHVPDALLWVVGDRGQVNLAQALALVDGIADKAAIASASGRGHIDVNFRKAVAIKIVNLGTRDGPVNLDHDRLLLPGQSLRDDRQLVD